MDATLDAKLDFERKLSTFGVTVSGYHADNGRFADAAWKDSCQALNQKIQFLWGRQPSSKWHCRAPYP